MTSVHYLTPGTSAWAVRTSEDSEDLVADPFWRTKQSSTASKDAIVIRCGAGFIKRSTDGGENFSDVTPTSDPPNDAGDSPAPTVGNCTFNQLDASFSDQDVFVTMVTWQNASSEWRTWLYHTDDNFSTNGTWKAIVGGSGNDLTSWNTPSTDVDGGPAGNGDWYYSFAGWSQRDSIRSFAKMSNTKYVAMYLVDRNYDPGYETFWGYCRVIDILPNGTLSVGAEQGPWSYDVGLGNEVQDARIYFWDEDYFIIVSNELDRENLPPGFYSLLARAGSVNGQVITFGTNYQIEDIQCGAMSFAKLPGTDHGIILASNLGSIGNEHGFAWVVEKSAISYSLTFGSQYIWQENTFGGGIGVDNFDIVAYDEDTATIFFNSGYDDTPYGQWNLYAIHTTVNRTIKSLAFGANQRMDLSAEVRDLHAAVLTSTRIVLVLVPQSPLYMYSAMITKSGSTYSVLDTEDIAANADSPYWNMQIEKISATRWVVFWDDWSPDPANPVEIHARIGYMVTGVLHQYGDVIKFTELSPDPTKYRLLTAPTGFPTSEYLICFFGDEQDAGTGTFWNVRAITADLTTGFETKGLGISIGKGAGNLAWVTAWDSVNGLVLIGINLTTFVIEHALNLGSATESEMNAKTWTAYPFAMWGGYDTQVMIYGRMDTGGGAPVHIIYPSGLDFAVVESGWGINHCGSLIRFPDGQIYAVRNDGAATKLYTGTVDGLDLKSVLPFDSGVDPHGMAVDPIDGAVVACTQVAGSIMVAVSPYPYAVWTNITSDHGLTEGINAVAVL